MSSVEVDSHFASAGGLPPRSYAETDPIHPIAGGRIRYVEAKRPNWQRLMELSGLCLEQNQWTNSGPLSLALGRMISNGSDLPDEYRTVMTSSGTAALYAAAGIFAARAGKQLRWAISAFGFLATRTGPFAGMTVGVDSDEHGFLDLSALVEMADNEWDGLLVTRPFGLDRDMSAYRQFCGERGKPLIVDAALAFPGLRTVGQNVIEIVSFHHTKPWGFGEGGCLFVPAADEALARSILSFGDNEPAWVLPSVSNGKLSDLAAAAIIDRLETMPIWSPRYHAQRKRICELVERSGLEQLGAYDDVNIAASVPVLAHGPIALGDLPDVGFDCGKYYAPLSASAGTAGSIYGRVVNIPCHGDMAEIADAQIESLLERMARRS
ncbi:DegT/DnrJ/EryC1/StrS family aminotransferase [Mesorhizobium sp. CO1-1-4]|uniref:DegT/DnrJ/EryC1/StrS family aminotransferase n=1 Tax=Mesorhizobium sp. CO1-1-4 TaxID=2876633 RepID=UPI001CCC13BE|nr:DegT/DnrJ/EryC1/StrS family aminotransferase [Mesorhizobium sp. CO1-1-4]MBZ9742351.1 DegT/DnrJ/EryC1/StrS family aminotransferase [Mesorhizobium sp. CO1-1-4]